MANLAILMAKFYSLKYHFLLGNQRFLEKKDEIDKMNLEYLDSKKVTRRLGQHQKNLCENL